MIVDENGDKCSAKDLANEILLRCLENISSYLRENPNITDKLSKKESLAVNEQLVKQATRCYKLLGVHEDDIDHIFDPDDPRAQPDSVSLEGEVMSDEDKQDMRDALAAEDAMTMDNVPTSVDTMEERREKEIKERNAAG